MDFLKLSSDSTAENEDVLAPLNSLKQDHDSNSDTEDYQTSRVLIQEKSANIKTRWLAIASLLLLLSNGAWLIFILLHSGSAQHIGAASFLSHSEAPYISKALYWNTRYAENPKVEANKLWADLFPKGQGLVTVNSEWAKSNSLPKSIEDRHDPSQSVYFVAVFHQLHCLSVVRAALFHYHEHKEQTVEWSHMIHCVDSIRQALMCSADDTLLYSNDSQTYGDGQLHVCRDWRALVKWTEDNKY